MTTVQKPGLDSEAMPERRPRPRPKPATEQPVQRWAAWAAWTAVWCTVPSCAWRMAAGFGVDVGFTGKLGRLYHGPAFLFYVWTLTVTSQAAACLTLGLIRPWGERVPRWTPRLGGRRIPSGVVVVVASCGAVAVTALCLAVALAPHGPLENPDFPRGTAGAVMAVCYAPLLAWGPLVAAATVGYVRRRGHQASKVAVGAGR